jgi:hypothetical protein
VKPPPSGPTLTRKEVCFHFKRGRTTVWRWELEGAPFVGGRVDEFQLLWWLEQRDAAKTLGIPVREFLKHSKPEREALLEAALVSRGAPPVHPPPGLSGDFADERRLSEGNGLGNEVPNPLRKSAKSADRLFSLEHFGTLPA